MDLQKLIAFADNELPLAERAEVEAALANDPALRAQLAAHHALRQRLSATFDSVLDEKIPERLLSVAQRPANVVSLSERRKAERWSVREWGAIAASLAGGLILGLGMMANQSPAIVATTDGLAARGVLAHALDVQLATDAPTAVRMGISFRNRDGAYCRTFTLAPQQTSGLACRAQDEWRIAATAHASPAGGELRTAGAETPQAILAAVEASIDGDPLDAAAEAQARAAGWR
jgi:hypothetical protein